MTLITDITGNIYKDTLTIIEAIDMPKKIVTHFIVIKILYK